ncbi:putative bifunctional diguanylate cyclase/phosphodiesterase [Vibrio sp. MA40-2]|uniref:putative bifunctional diguanylate cyclase/phosphodiesterase n=1 Tax=Vibrio sp. MA40-2 TaxID=3391828 RepID=UPI0039A659CC
MISPVPKIRSLEIKVVAFFMVIALFAVLTSALTIIGYEKNNSKAKELHRLESIAEILSPALTAAVVFKDEYSANELLFPLMSDHTIVDANVVETDGKQFVGITSPYIDSKIQNTHFIVVKKSLILDDTRYGQLIIRANDLSIQEHISVYSMFITLIGAITLAISLVMAIVFSRYIVKPIAGLGELANQVTQSNNYSLRAVKTSNDELGVLTDYFNLMLKNIEYRDKTLESEVRQRTAELKDANDLLHRQAYFDSLSDLPNRRYLNESLQQHVNSYHAGEISGFSILFLDLDGFKEVNDTLGHDQGDILLISVANRLQEVIDSSHLVARLGGDEFTVLMTDTIQQEATSSAANNIHNALSDPFFINGEEVLVTVSIGIAIFPTNGSDVETILKCADLAMYEAKALGRNCFSYFDSLMMNKLIEKRQLVADLKVALLEEQFELYFQPIVDLQSGNIDKVEALIRWNHPTKGLVYPDDFIPVAEEFGIINEIGQWVVKNASHHIPILHNLFQRDIKININVSPAQFKGGFKWIDSWLQDCEQYQLNIKLICFEITENLLMTSDEVVRDRLKQLKILGVDIAIDDFGVGYSSLSYLQQINIDILKIDRSFVQNLCSDVNSQALCKAMINMADELGIKVVAEGIEERQHAELLASYGCRYGQGYYYTKPVPVEELVS